MSYRAAALACILLIPSLLSADVTLTYKTENTLSPSLPPAFDRTSGSVLEVIVNLSAAAVDHGH